jgi:outer membrane protein OmpA-like peptidoglycan-associated protein
MMVDRSQIRQHMNVLASDGQRLGTVDEIEGDRIKLTKDSSPDGQHHYAAIADVARVDGDTLHLSRTRDSIFGTAAAASGAGATAAGATAAHASPLPEIKNPAVAATAPRRNYMLPWVLGALVVLALLALLTQCGKHDDRTTTTTTTTQTVTPHVAGAPLRDGTLAYSLDQFLSSKDGLPRTFTFDKLNFDTGSATLREADMTDLDDIARVFAAYPGARAAIVGYTDANGNPQANANLGADRARAVIAALQQRGIDPARLEARTGGENNPVAPNATGTGRFENRRTDLVLLKR